MIQLAWLWLRYQPGSELAEWFRERVGTLAGRTRRIAIVAMARKLLIALWRYAETGWCRLAPRSGRRRQSRHRQTGIASGSIRRRRYGERDRFRHWWHNAAAFQVGRISPGQRLVHEALWCGTVLRARPHVR